MRHGLAAAFAASTLLVAPCADAQDVTLSSPRGGVEISGRLLSHDGEFYRIDSIYGVLTVDASGVDCRGTGCPGPGAFVAEVMISGVEGASARLMPTLLEAFARHRNYDYVRQQEDGAHFLYVLTDPEVDVTVARVRFRVTSAAEGFADLLAEAADVAVAMRAPLAEEAERAVEAGLGDLRAHERGGVLALDAFVPVVATENPVAAISRGDLARVLSGEIRSWEALGGDDAPIRVHLPAPGSDLRAELLRRILGEGENDPEGVTNHLSLDSLEAAVLADPFALGVTIHSAIGPSRPLAVAGTCGARIAPERLTIKTEDYPLTAPHFFYTPRLRPPAFLRDFLAFVRSSEAQVGVREAGFVDQAIEFRDLETQGTRLIRAVLASGSDVSARDLRRTFRALDGAEQMSLSFRFEDGSADLDIPSQANVALLADALRRGEFEGRTVLLAGFSDGQGGGATNLDLSRRRAEAVRQALLARLPGQDFDASLVADGFGEAMPLACDEDAWGRQINRRVEVWLR